MPSIGFLDRGLLGVVLAGAVVQGSPPVSAEASSSSSSGFTALLIVAALVVGYIAAAFIWVSIRCWRQTTGPGGKRTYQAAPAGEIPSIDLMNMDDEEAVAKIVEAGSKHGCVLLENAFELIGLGGQRIVGSDGSAGTMFDAMSPVYEEALAQARKAEVEKGSGGAAWDSASHGFKLGRRDKLSPPQDDLKMCELLDETDPASAATPEELYQDFRKANFTAANSWFKSMDIQDLDAARLMMMHNGRDMTAPFSSEECRNLLEKHDGGSLLHFRNEVISTLASRINHLLDLATGLDISNIARNKRHMFRFLDYPSRHSKETDVQSEAQHGDTDHSGPVDLIRTSSGNTKKNGFYRHTDTTLYTLIFTDDVQSLKVFTGLHQPPHEGIRVPKQGVVLVYGWLLDVLTESQLRSCYHEVDLATDRRVVAVCFFDADDPIKIKRATEVAQQQTQPLKELALPMSELQRVKRLLECLDRTRKRHNNESMMILAAQWNRVDLGRRLIAHYGAKACLVDDRDWLGMTALHYCTLHPNGADFVHMVMQSLPETMSPEDRRAFVNIGDEDGFTALHMANITGFLDVADALLAYGADPSLQTTSGYTPEDYMRIRGDMKFSLYSEIDPEVALPPEIGEQDAKQFLGTQFSSESWRRIAGGIDGPRVTREKFLAAARRMQANKGRTLFAQPLGTDDHSEPWATRHYRGHRLQKLRGLTPRPCKNGSTCSCQT